MKRIFISEEQKKLIKESLELSSVMGDSFPSSFKENPAFPKGYINKALSERFKILRENFTDDITAYSEDKIATKLNKLTEKCLKIERNIRPQLENICLNTVNEIFHIPDEGVEISCELCDEIPSTQQFHITPDTDSGFVHDSVESMENEEQEIFKRQIINALVDGGATELMNSNSGSCLKDIFELNEELPHLYSQIMKINDYLSFIKKIEIKDNQHYQGSYVNVSLGNENKVSKIESKAVIFPLLLQETIKGVLELIASNGLPDSYDTANRVIDAADLLENEPWYHRIGSEMWKRVYKPEIKNLPEYFLRIVSLPCDEFIASVKEIFANTRKGEEILDKLKNEINYNVDFNDFQNTLKNKQKELIDDDYFTDQELDEAAYPSNFNMEEFKSLSSFAARVKYCEERLNRISQGSSRIVYTVDNNTVLKLAKNKKGVAQNEEEGQYDYYKQGIGLFAEVYDVDENYLWIEMQFAKKAKPSDFKRITGYDFKTVCEWLNYVNPNQRYSYVDPKYKTYFQSEEFQENYDEYSILTKLQDYIGSYDAPIGDLKRISSWGIVTDENGEENLVLIDFGLSDDIYNNFYARR